MVKDTTVRNMWDIVSEPPAPRAPAPHAPSLDFDALRAPADPFGDAPRRNSRVKTRVLGIDHSNGTLEALGANKPVGAEAVKFPVGWLVVVEGPGRGSAIPIRPGASPIGRGEDQAVQLDFGDSAISRTGHATIAFDDETRAFFLGHGGKSNLVRLNGRPLLSTEEVKHGDTIRIGETTLMLAALCNKDFTWNEDDGG